MNSNYNAIVLAALGAKTKAEATEVQRMIAASVGARYQRPVGNTWNNQGILTASGASYDHKAIEPVTNMQDAIVERFALEKFGSAEAVPYSNPHEAAGALLSSMTTKECADLCSITIDAAVDPPGKKKVTLTMRDQGCGITTRNVPDTIFRVGAGHKDGIDWQQGTFGLGGATTYRNAECIVLVTRRQPSLLAEGEEDRITVAVVEWDRQRTTINASYLVATEFELGRPTTWADAVPFSVPATDCPEFEPGTHLALVGFDTPNFSRRSGDEKSFDTVLNTRLFKNVLPIDYRNNMTRAERSSILLGLEKRFEENPGEPGTSDSDVLPINIDGTTYQLPVRYRLFSKRGEKGERRNFVAHNHALLITSNGQVHRHWTPQEFKSRTSLNKLDGRILVIVESDALPIEVRTEMFTADRAQLVDSVHAQRLESEIVAFLNGWSSLVDVNKQLIREAITGDNNDRPTIAIAEKIARAMKVRGFSAAGAGKKGGGKTGPKPTPAEDLYDDPTHFEGVERLQAKAGSVKSVYYKLNAKDGFLGEGGRGQLELTCDHPDVAEDEITIGSLRGGRVRVSIAVPEGADLGEFQLEASIPEWTKVSGGIGPAFTWSTVLEFVDEFRERDSGKPDASGNGKGAKGAGSGALVAMIWETEDTRDEWTAKTVGEIEYIEGSVLAEKKPEYRSLAKIEEKIPTIVLNRTYSPLKNYVQARAVQLTDEGKEQARERYAVGAGVALLVLDEERRRAPDDGAAWDDQRLTAAHDSAARGVLSVLPEYDALAREMDE